MKLFSSAYLNSLAKEAKSSTRLRQHRNIHESYQDPSQRLFNAIEPGSYIRPHRHSSDPKDELLVAVRGLMVLLKFDDQGNVTQAVQFGTEQYGPSIAVGVEIQSNTWHTVIALQPGCVLLEVKSGPFDPRQPKDLAPWAPEEGTASALDYMTLLQKSLAKVR